MPVPGPMVEQGSRAAMADPEIRAAMADLGSQAPMADQGIRAAMADQGLRGPWWVAPAQNFLGEVHNLWGAFWIGTW